MKKSFQLYAKVRTFNLNKRVDSRIEQYFVGLESESRTLARRMSAVSISSVEEPLPPKVSNRLETTQHYDRPFTATASASHHFPPAIRAGSTSPSASRSRTYSQPYKATGSPHLNGYAAKPTRIPRSKRSQSITSSRSQQPIPYRPSTDTIQPSAANLRVVHEVESQSSLTELGRKTSKTSAILNEPAPFQPDSAASTLSTRQAQETPPRLSTDSEERPYQHWYRGDVSRNGGVGELRVAKRMEMLEIANYGHRPAAETPNAITRAINERRRQRRRADSLDSRHRASLYLDEDALEQVMDEDPLTDLDYDPSEKGHDPMDFYQDYYDEYEAPEPEPEPDETIDLSTASAPMTTHDSRSITPTHHQAPPTTQITAPTSFIRGQSEPPSFPSSSQTTPSTPKSKSKRGTSPAPPPSASKKARQEAARATRAKTENARRQMVEEEKRRSVAYYPAIEGDVENAIPTWTQAIPKSGNWDEVVLPVVARKKGLDGHYEQGDGSPKPPSPQDSMIEPVRRSSAKCLAFIAHYSFSPTGTWYLWI
jgi:hypothetical protein